MSAEAGELFFVNISTCEAMFAHPRCFVRQNANQGDQNEYRGTLSVFFGETLREYWVLGYSKLSAFAFVVKIEIA